jgi:hypothetical protein
MEIGFRFTSYAREGFTPLPDEVHHQMGKREVKQAEFAAACPCVRAIVQYTALLPRAGGVETIATLRDQGGCKLSCVVCRSLSFYCLLVTVRVFCLSNNLDLIVMTSSGVSKRDWTPSMQDAIPHRGFYVIKVHDLIGSFSADP